MQRPPEVDAGPATQSDQLRRGGFGASDCDAVAKGGFVFNAKTRRRFDAI